MFGRGNFRLVSAKCPCFVQISLENEDFPRAIEDIAECLSKRVQALPADSRYMLSFAILIDFTV